MKAILVRIGVCGVPNRRPNAPKRCGRILSGSSVALESLLVIAITSCIQTMLKNWMAFGLPLRRAGITVRSMIATLNDKTVAWAGAHTHRCRKLLTLRYQRRTTANRHPSKLIHP